MKYATILFTFLGLIAATVTALPSPIHLRKSTKIQAHDVWADDPILSRYFEETYDMSERSSADAILETRQAQVAAVAEGVETAVQLTQAVLQVFNAIQGQVQQDKDKRSQWTQDMIGQWRAQNPGWNFVICHTAHKFEPKQGTPSQHTHQELNVSFGKTIGYEIYWFKEGTFRRIGDGGWLNWAYAGNVKSTTDGGKTLEFGPP